MPEAVVLYQASLEDVEEAYRQLIIDNIPVALAAVEAKYAGTRFDFALPAPDDASVMTGNLPIEALPDTMDAYPFIWVEATSVVDTGSDVTVDVPTVMVVCVTMGDDAEQANKACHRYALAAATVIARNEPPLGSGVKRRGRINIDTAETIGGFEAAFVKLCRVRFSVIIGGAS